MCKTKILLLFTICLLSCRNAKIDKELNEYLRNFDVDIKTCKVVCIVPADGCMSCSMPSLEYASKGNSNFLLVLTSNFQKSIDLLIESNPNVLNSRVVIDSDNLALKNRLLFVTSPSIYLIKNGRVEKLIDLSEYKYQEEIFKEIDQYLSI
jgi:hypothetical protein